jgi:hypothetical protein
MSFVAGDPYTGYVGHILLYIVRIYRYIIQLDVVDRGSILFGVVDHASASVMPGT